MFFTYALSFIFVGIYWVNHHHLLHATQRVNGRILWATCTCCSGSRSSRSFWRRMQAGHYAALPTAMYGVALLDGRGGLTILARAIVANEGRESAVAAALGSDFKGKISVVLYAIAFRWRSCDPRIADGVYAVVALMWLIPDRRIEARVRE